MGQGQVEDLVIRCVRIRFSHSIMDIPSGPGTGMGMGNAGTSRDFSRVSACSAFPKHGRTGWARTYHL